MIAYYGSRLSPHMIDTPEGYLVCKDVPIARTGIQDYMGREFGGKVKDRIYKVERPESEVFDRATIASFEGKPVADEHPDEDITSENYRRYIKGICRDVHRGEGEFSDFLMANLIIYDSDLIKAIKNGKREISCGYDCLWEPKGEYGFIQRKIRGNHIAVVERGRAGHMVKIRDAAEERKRKYMGYLGKKNLWGRMLASFAKDADTTPEDMENASKLKPAEDEEEKPAPAPAPEKEEKAPAFDAEALNERLTRIEDALDRLCGARDEDEPEDLEPEDDQEGDQNNHDPDALDALEGELKGEPAPDPQAEPDQDSSDMNSGDVVEEDAQDEDDGVEQLRQAALSAIKALRPVVAQIPDAGDRKRASDSLAMLIRGTVHDSGYAFMMQVKRDSKPTAETDVMDDRALGRMIRDKFNPHYMKKQ